MCVHVYVWVCCVYVHIYVCVCMCMCLMCCIYVCRYVFVCIGKNFLLHYLCCMAAEAQNSVSVCDSLSLDSCEPQQVIIKTIITSECHSLEQKFKHLVTQNFTQLAHFYEKVCVTVCVCVHFSWVSVVCVCVCCG